MSMKERLAEYGDFVDVGILHHGFAAHMRDYEVLFEALWGHKDGADAKGTYILRFTHCPEATAITVISTTTTTRANASPAGTSGRNWARRA